MSLDRDEERRVEELLAETAEQNRRSGRDTAYIRVLRSAARRVLREEVAEAIGALSEGGIGAAIGFLTRAAEAWSGRWRARMAPPILAVMEGTADERREALAGVDPAVAERFPAFDSDDPDMGGRYSDQVEKTGLAANTSREKIGAILRDAQERGLGVREAADAIREAEPEMVRSRADFVAQDALLKASKGARNAQAKASGVCTTKTRHDSGDSHVREQHEDWDGETVGIDEEYGSGEQFPGEREWGCRCSETYGIDFDALGA